MSFRLRLPDLRTAEESFFEIPLGLRFLRIQWDSWRSLVNHPLSTYGYERFWAFGPMSTAAERRCRDEWESYWIASGGTKHHPDSI